MELEGRHVVVTGAGRGIGREHALALARAGAKVVVNDLGASLDGTVGGEQPALEVVRVIESAGLNPGVKSRPPSLGNKPASASATSRSGRGMLR